MRRGLVLTAALLDSASALASVAIVVLGVVAGDPVLVGVGLVQVLVAGVIAATKWARLSAMIERGTPAKP